MKLKAELLNYALSLLMAGATLLSVTTPVQAADKKPNIVVIFADDVGPWNVSAYHQGMMGGRTPNIDRIASQGARFTDYYAQQSCTAGRSAFVTGQHPFRTGLLRAGFPAAKQGIQVKDPTSDNGPQIFTWPDGGNTPFKGEKGTTWEGGFRVPAVVRWPGVIKPGTIVNDIMSHEDWLPTFLAAAGDPDVKTRLLAGMKAGDKAFKAHLDGYNFLPFFSGAEAKAPRHEIFYFDDGANLNALRYDDWKITFQVFEGNIFSGKRTTPNMPFVVNLRQDPFERFPSESLQYMAWMGDKLWAFVPAQVVVGQFLQSFKEFPPSQKSGSFGIGQALEAIAAGAQGGGK